MLENADCAFQAKNMETDRESLKKRIADIELEENKV
jgi:hypothetical protein